MVLTIRTSKNTIKNMSHMKIVNHRLMDENDYPLPYQSSPNYTRGRTLQPDYIVIHYTAGSSAKNSIDWLCNPTAKASAHIVIGRDGEITQLVNFNKIAWHAGISAWDNKTNINRFSIGIELENAGQLTKQGNNWVTWFGSTIENNNVMLATHKNRTDECGWHTYTEAQIRACQDLCILLTEKYAIKEIIGHDDICPQRKTDPGPAFPLTNIASQVMGRQTQDEQLPIVKTTTHLNIRTGPGTQHSKLEEGPLPTHTAVLVLEKVNNWHFVEVLDEINGHADVQGWVHGAYLS